VNVAELIRRLQAMPQDAPVRANVVEPIDPDEAPLDSAHDGERVAQGPVNDVVLHDHHAPVVVWLECGEE
jgi:hypothetical protein